MKKTPGKDHRGVSRSTAGNPTAKTGRDSMLKKNKPKRGVDNVDSPNPTVRAGRDSGAMSNRSYGPARTTSVPITSLEEVSEA